MSEDLDEVAVERACKGDRTVTLNRAEAAQAFRLLDRRGFSAQEIADLLGVSQRTVQGWRDGRSTPITRPGATVDNVKEKIATALKHESAQIRRAAQRANADLATLDTLLADWDAKDAARERVAELERALAEARAVLHPKKSTPPKKAGNGAHAKARAWALANGVPIAPTGRVPTAIIEQCERATSGAA